MWFFAVPFVSIAQISVGNEVYLNGDSVDAKFEGGGTQKFHDYIIKNINSSILTKPGKVVFTFTVSETGEIKNIRIVEFSYIEIATEIIRVIKTAPSWQPAKRAGKPISFDVKLPMEFSKKALEISNIENGINKKPALSFPTPSFPGGQSKFLKYFMDNFRTPDLFVDIKGKIYISFTVNEDGTLDEIEVTNNLGKYVANEARRVMKKCPKFSPATQNGKPIKCHFRLPVNINFVAHE